MAKKVYSADFKFRAALEALKGLKTLNELASGLGVHPNQIRDWKKRLKENGKDIFSNRRQNSEQEAEALQAQLYEEIGRLKVELDWLKKKVL